MLAAQATAEEARLEADKASAEEASRLFAEAEAAEAEARAKVTAEAEADRARAEAEAAAAEAATAATAASEAATEASEELAEVNRVIRHRVVMVTSGCRPRSWSRSSPIDTSFIRLVTYIPKV